MIQSTGLPGLNPHRLTHQLHTFPSGQFARTGSGPNLLLSVGPPHMSSNLSSHRQVTMSIKFMPLASEISIGDTRPRKSEDKKEETKEMRAVASYTPGFRRRICGPKSPRVLLLIQVHITYPRNLISGKPLIRPASRPISDNFGTTELVLEVLTVLCGG